MKNSKKDPLEGIGMGLGQKVNPHGLRVNVIGHLYYFNEWDRKIETTIAERERLVENAPTYEKKEKIKRIYNHRVEMFLEKKYKEIDKQIKDIDAKIEQCQQDKDSIFRLNRQNVKSNTYNRILDIQTNLTEKFLKERLKKLLAEKAKMSGGTPPDARQPNM